MNDAFSFHVRNPIYLSVAAITATLSIVLSARIEAATESETLALTFSIFMVLVSIFLFIKAMRPITITLLPDGLQVGPNTFSKKQILHLALNQRYRRITIHTAGTKRPIGYSLMRKTDLPYVHQALAEWSEQTGMNVDLKDSWGS